MRRFAEEHLSRWYAKPRRKPLVVRGARQVGKSTLIRDFAAASGLILYEVNLERHKTLERVFKRGNTDEVLRELAYACKAGSVTDRNSLLFLDEIQATPSAIPFLRYLYEDRPELAVASAGSLLEFALSKHSFSMPVGRIEYLFLGPMTFLEFLFAHDASDLAELLTSSDGGQVPGTAHDRLLGHLRDFFLVGGLPEAVLASVEGDLADVADVHSSIIETYIDDFGKYARESQLTRLQTAFLHVPANAGRKVVYSRIDPHSQARDMKPIVDLLLKARLLTGAYHCAGNGLPLRAEIDWRVFKLYLVDVGLLNSMCGTRHLSLDQILSTAFVNEGAVAEQFVAQHLLHCGRPNASPELNYWLREGKTNNAEVDFLLHIDGSVVPVEVKAGKAGTLKSLHRFMHDKKARRAARLDVNPPSRQTVEVGFRMGSGSASVRYALHSFPIYMAELIPRLMEHREEEDRQC